MPMKLSAERLTEAVPATGPLVHPDAPAVLEVRDLRPRYARPDGSWATAVDGISFDVHAGEIMVLLGPGGSGKTTLLRSVAGLASPDSGTVRVHGRTVFSSRTGICLPPERRGLNMVRHSFVLRPHLTVFENVACPPPKAASLGCSLSRPRKQWDAAQVLRVLAAMGLERLAKHYPGQLSAAQQQRVALCQALIGNARVMLFDEPLASVTPWTRDQLRIDLLLLQREIGFAAIFVTRDQREALALAHTVAVLDQGRILQHAAPGEVYEAPPTAAVAALLGVANQIGGVVVEAAGRDVVVNTVIGPIAARCPVAFADDRLPLCEGDAATLMWRPAAARLTADEAGREAAPGRRTGVVERSWPAKAGTETVVRVGDERFRVQAGGPTAVCGTRVCLELDPARVFAYPDNTSTI
jgi:iron(III) transport system ATP-binding protein